MVKTDIYFELMYTLILFVQVLQKSWLAFTIYLNKKAIFTYLSLSIANFTKVKE